MADLILDITQTEEVNRKNFQRIYEDNFKQIERNLNSSKGKDIVAFVGLTGSGKSTLINYLCRKELQVDEDDNIVLKNSNDSNAMQIGITSVSETFLPKFIDCNNFLLYDLPGFGDSRGTLVNLFNSTIVKNIVENAKSVIIVVVISEDELIAGRGRLFKELVLRLNFFLPNETLEDNSVLVVTKSSPRKNIEYLVRKIRQKTGGDVVIKWCSNGCFAKMERACERKINEVDRNQIFNAICNVQKKHISHIDTCAIYDERSLSVLRKICKEEM